MTSTQFTSRETKRVFFPRTTHLSHQKSFYILDDLHSRNQWCHFSGCLIGHCENSISCSPSSLVDTIQEFLLPRLLLLVAEELLLLPVAPRCCFLRSNMLAERRFCFRTDTIAKPPINRQITWSRTCMSNIECIHSIRIGTKECECS